MGFLIKFFSDCHCTIDREAGGAKMPYHLSQPIRLAEYDPRWPALFQEERKLLLGVLDSRVVAIEHFGSTSVPGLAAKPILDILAGVSDLEAVSECEEALQATGYADARIQVPGRQLFCRGPYNEGTHHLHFVEHGSEAWEQPLRFRDALRAHPGKVQEYELLKRQLAALHGTDLDGYSDGKGLFVQSVLSEHL
jgi:GrpB-like predicted nucleotidyltransferase (UPF0157 family)